jgi:16S rRNA (cytidine1402-2'-O)-methyltransferase
MSSVEKGRLYLVGTPIGNLGDMTFRAVETLKEVDFIAAEDTRVSRKLLTHFGISKPMVSYYEHNRQESGVQIVNRIAAGESCALVTDAGMPAISDPGSELVKWCAEAGIEVLAIPGASAVTSAVALSGLNSSRFCFEGFLSVNKQSRREHLESIKKEKRAMVFYEAPHKLRATLSDLAETFGKDRKISLCREITKIHEECIRTTLGEAMNYYEETEPRGEFALVIEGSSEQESKPGPEDAVARALLLVKEGMTARDAARITAQETGISKNILYKALIENGRNSGEAE